MWETKAKKGAIQKYIEWAISFDFFIIISTIKNKNV